MWACPKGRNLVLKVIKWQTNFLLPPPFILRKPLFILPLALIFFLLAACKESDPTPITDPALNGTWTGSYDTWKFNNGAFEYFSHYPDPDSKGTFTTSGTSLTFTNTHIWGKALDTSLPEKWYTKAELIAAGKDEGVVNAYFALSTYSYSVSGNTLTLDGGYGTYTKQ